MKKYNDTYSKVKSILIRSVPARNSDKKLIWQYWSEELYGRNTFVEGYSMTRLTFNNFMSVASPETITRARRKVCEEYPGLRGNEPVEVARRKREAKKGTFIYEDK